MRTHTRGAMTETTPEILRRYYTDVWEHQRTDRIATFFHDTVPPDILLPERPIEPSEVREWIEVVHSLVRDIQVTFLRTIEQGEWTSAFLKIDCTSHQTGKAVSVYQHIMVRQVNGKLVESYPQFDLLRFFEQIGQLPENAYELLMAGTQLR